MLEVPIACGTRFEICASLKFTYDCPPYPPNVKTGTPQKLTKSQSGGFPPHPPRRLALPVFEGCCGEKPAEGMF